MNWLRWLRDEFFPPRLSRERLTATETEIREATIETNRLAETFEQAATTARERREDPLETLIRDVSGRRKRGGVS